MRQCSLSQEYRATLNLPMLQQLRQPPVINRPLSDAKELKLFRRVS